jgi:hypothetical protein
VRKLGQDARSWKTRTEKRSKAQQKEAKHNRVLLKERGKRRPWRRESVPPCLRQAFYQNQTTEWGVSERVPAFKFDKQQQ